MKRFIIVMVTIAALVGLAGTSHAQYVYLDTNGDGVWSGADHMNANGTPTVVDAWINTNHNKNGSLALCDTGDGDLGFWNSYAVNLGAANGTVTFTNFVNQQSTFTISCAGIGVDFISNSTEMTACRAAATSQAAGLKKMFTVTITGQSGSPSIQYLALGALGPNFTSFGTPCSGNDFDNTYKLGSDFFDNDGLSAGGIGDLAPVVSAPASASFSIGSPGSVTVSAADPDGQAITSLTEVSTPATTGSTFTAGAGNTSGTFDWTPNSTQTGTYTLTFTASNALSGSAATTLTVGIADRPPVVTAPATAGGAENTLISFTISVTDPDGQAIATLSASSLPPTTGSGMSLDASRTSGTWSWTPSFFQQGSYNVDFTASNTLSGTARTLVTVTNVDRAPTVSAPASVSVSVNGLVNFNVTANDPDGEAITSLTAVSSPPTTGSAFVVNASKNLANFSWTPTAAQVGTYTVTFTASNALSGSAATMITVNPNVNPVVTAPVNQSVNEGVLLQFAVTATDADGDHVSLTMLQPAPFGSSFEDFGDNTGAFTWTPTFNQAGGYTVDFRGTDGNGGVATDFTAITVVNVDHPPVADAGGPYAGITNVPVQLIGSGSSDPDGELVSFMWDFGDGRSSTEMNPVHTYTAQAVYNVILTVTSGPPGGPLLTDTDNTTATISDHLGARAFAVGGNTKTSLGAGKPFTTFQVEPVGGSYDNSQVQLASIRMIYPVGSTNQISADGSKTGLAGDKDGNGVSEISVAFSKDNMRILFAGLPAGNNTVTIEIRGDLAGGGNFSATLDHIVKSNGSFLAASISPNPLNPRAKLSFTTTKPGAVRVQMFDPQGRLVKTIADELVAMAGYHDYAIDGKSSSGTKLASGVYFVKVWSEHDGDEVQRIAILK